MIIFLNPMIHIRIYPRMLFLRCSLLILVLPARSQQADTIRQGESLRDGETLVSSLPTKFSHWVSLVEEHQRIVIWVSGITSSQMTR